MTEATPSTANLEGRTIVITGASSGVGAAAARALAARGATVAVLGRDPERTAQVAAEVGTEPIIADFASFDQVEQAAATIAERYPQIDVLANNAGGVFGSQDKTDDGFNLIFQINHLSPFLLTNLLLPNLLASGASIIQTSSVGNMFAPTINLSDLDMDDNFNQVRAYGAAKLENILFTTELHRRFHDQGISSVAFHPGSVATGFGSGAAGFMRSLVSNGLFRRLFLVTPEQGASQLVRFASTSAGDDWVSGDYYERGKPATRVNPQARDGHLAQALWEKSVSLLGDRLPIS